LILEGRVSVNGKVITELSFFVDEENETVFLDGERIKPESKVYFLLNKPRGYITTTSDEKGRKKVTDLIKTRQKIFPVGRLDYDTTGVLLLTNDGNFSNFLTHPSNGIPREYKVTLDKPLEEEDRIKLLKGIRLEGKPSKFQEIVFKGGKQKVKVVTVEGRNHYVKNMFRAVGYWVKSLERTSFGIFNLDDLPVGAYRKLSYSEIEKFYRKYEK
jgi:23S rRNA pseudouridine2605 synthase